MILSNVWRDLYESALVINGINMQLTASDLRYNEVSAIYSDFASLNPVIQRR